MDRTRDRTARRSVAERLVDLAASPMLRPARVVDVERLSSRFVAVELHCDAFRKVVWTPGAKVQFRPKRGTFGLRTYTPTQWSTEAGTTRLIAFMHGDGPGSYWFRGVEVGQVFEVFGPRRSIDLTEVTHAVVFVGDETSVGLAVALRGIAPDGVCHVFESTDPDELTEVLRGLGLGSSATVVAKADDRVALQAAVRDAVESYAAGFDLVVTGDAATVAAVRRDARDWPKPASTTKVKAYWAKGRTGLD